MEKNKLKSILSDLVFDAGMFIGALGLGGNLANYLTLRQVVNQADNVEYHQAENSERELRSYLRDQRSYFNVAVIGGVGLLYLGTRLGRKSEDIQEEMLSRESN